MSFFFVTTLLLSFIRLLHVQETFHDEQNRLRLSDEAIEEPCVVCNTYTWHTNDDKNNALANRIVVPEGYERVPALSGSFADWLRHLPLKHGNPPVYLHNRAEKSYQDGHYAVVDIDVGSEDLQQCVDAIIRLYAEYLFSQNALDNIAFKLSNGDVVTFRKWFSGHRPIVSGNRVTWHKHAQIDSSYNTFREYLKFIFMYAGTYSLSQQIQTVADIDELEIGDIFVQTGFPGHAILVVDVAINPGTQEKIFLLCQSYMPAQDIHILKSLNDPTLNPWYKLDFGKKLYTPEWTFTSNDLKRF